MSDVDSSTVATRDVVLKVLSVVAGYEIETDANDLSFLDSLQILELLVTLEEELNIDSDIVIDARTDWWSSVDSLVEAVHKARSSAEA
jgi:acyl carrier protein